MFEATQRNPLAAMDTTSKVAAAQHTTVNFLLVVLLVDRCRRCTWNVRMDLRDAVAAAQHGKVRGAGGLRGAAIIIVVLCSTYLLTASKWNGIAVCSCSHVFCLEHCSKCFWPDSTLAINFLLRPRVWLLLPRCGERVRSRAGGREAARVQSDGRRQSE